MKDLLHKIAAVDAAARDMAKSKAKEKEEHVKRYGDIGKSVGGLTGMSVGALRGLSRRTILGAVIGGYIGKELGSFGGEHFGRQIGEVSHAVGGRPKEKRAQLKVKKKIKKSDIDKYSADVRIPKGGLRSGLLMSDLTQTMDPEDAALVKKKLPFYRRSGLGLLPIAGLGAGVGALTIPDLVRNITDLHRSVKDLPSPPAVSRKGRLIGAAVGSVALPALAYAMTRSGKHDNQALQASRKAIEQAKNKQHHKSKYKGPLTKESDDVRIPEDGLRPGLLMNDFSQTMSPEDAALVKKELPFYQRSNPGLLIDALSGAAIGFSVGFNTGIPNLPAVGAATVSGLNYAITRSGMVDKQYLKASRKVIEQARNKRDKQKGPITKESTSFARKVGGSLGSPLGLAAGVGVAAMSTILVASGSKGRKQMGKEIRDPRIYSNIRGMATLESKKKRVAAHKGLPKSKGSVLHAMKSGFTRSGN